MFGQTAPRACYHDALHRADVAPWSPQRGVESPKAVAFAHAEAHSPAGGFGGPTPIISFQLESGRRVYRCQPWPSFFRNYRAAPESKRVFYELSRSHLPCKLHFDIDEAEALPRGDRAAFDACYARVQAFVAWVSRKLAACWPALVDEAHAQRTPFVDVCWLDSSDVDKPKFSLHLVFNLVGHAMFADRAHLLRFTNWLAHEVVREDYPPCTHLPTADVLVDAYRRARAAGAPGAAIAALGDLKQVYLVDMSVYSEGDREFRLLFSHKTLEPKRVLRPYDPLRGTVRAAPLAADDEALFYASLVSYQPAAARVDALLQCHAQLGRPVFLRVSGGAGGGLAASLGAGNPAWTAGGGDDSSSAFESAVEQVQLVSSSGIRLRRKRARPESPAPGAAGAPLDLDTFFGDSAADDSAPGEARAAAPLAPAERLRRFELFVPRLIDDVVRQLPAADVVLRLLYYFPDEGCVTFASNSRYCEVRGGEHRSNSVYYVCWLRSGVFYQRCPDDECFARYVRVRDWGAAGPPPHLKHARGAARMLDPALWPEAAVLATGVEAEGARAAKRARLPAVDGGGGGGALGDGAAPSAADLLADLMRELAGALDDV